MIERQGKTVREDRMVMKGGRGSDTDSGLTERTEQAKRRRHQRGKRGEKE